LLTIGWLLVAGLLTVLGRGRGLLAPLGRGGPEAGVAAAFGVPRDPVEDRVAHLVRPPRRWRDRSAAGAMSPSLSVGSGTATPGVHSRAARREPGLSGSRPGPARGRRARRSCPRCPRRGARGRR